MAILLAYLKVPLSWREILTRMGREAMVFPALLLLVAIASYGRQTPPPGREAAERR